VKHILISLIVEAWITSVMNQQTAEQNGL